MSEEKKSLGKGLGKLAGSMLNLASKGAKKLENYANKSAEENQNEKAKKLAGWMNKLSQNIDEKHDAYVAKVESNADDLVNLSKKAIGKAKGVYGEMKQRAEVAKEKANQDSAETKEKPAKKTKAEATEEPAAEAETEVAATETEEAPAAEKAEKEEEPTAEA